MKFKKHDFLNLYRFFSDEEKLVYSNTQQFVKEEVSPIINSYFDKNKFPFELVKKIGEMGLIGINLPKTAEGSGMSSIAYGLACQELERGDSSIRSFVSVQSSLVMYPIYKYGTSYQKKKWLKDLSNGEIIGCFGLTETDFGSNPSGMKTNLKKNSTGYILNGSKMWITNGTYADIGIVWAKDDTNTIRGCIIEKGMEGFISKPIKNKLSLNASDTAELVFNNVYIPKKNILNIKGLKGPLSCLNQARFGIGWGVLGVASLAFEKSLKYSKERIQFNKPLASFQLIQKKLVWMLNEITKSQLLALQIAKNKDENIENHTQISMLKRNNVWVARECLKKARDIHGANGISSEYPIMRHLMNLESVYTYEGTHDIHTLILGEAITDNQAFY